MNRRNDKKANSIGVIIPTFKCPQAILISLLGCIQESSLETSILIVDSSSNNGTVETAKEMGVEVIVIPQSDFNHGATREMARKHLATDIVVMMTQDAIPESPEFLTRLIKPFHEDDKVKVSYARQLPHHGADIFEAFPREFNYAEKSQVRSIQDLSRYGVYTFFCSNSCAAYRNSALDEIGGFQSVLTNEDYFAVAEMLQRDYKIAYVADAEVRHSHRYTLWQEFQRYFDTGYVRAERPIIQELVGSAEGRGVGFVGALLKRVLLEKPWLVPYAILQSAVKWLGYRVGFYSQWIPDSLKKRLSQQNYYWTSKYYK